MSTISVKCSNNFVHNHNLEVFLSIKNKKAKREDSEDDNKQVDHYYNIVVNVYIYNI